MRLKMMKIHENNREKIKEYRHQQQNVNEFWNNLAEEFSNKVQDQHNVVQQVSSNFSKYDEY
jgi:hypothetical protein